MDEPIRDHIRNVAARGHAAERALVTRLSGMCWPSGGADRTHGMAREWVRRWHPGRIGAVLPACSCAAGRCAVCN